MVVALSEPTKDNKLSRPKRSPVTNLLEEREVRRKPVIAKPKAVTFKTKKQLHYYEAIMTNKVTVSSGSAGTGKTFVAVYSALCQLAAGNVEKIIITKPAVEIGETQGYLPGDMEEKMAPFIRSIEDQFKTLIGEAALNTLYSRKQLEIIPLNMMRGLTFDKAFVICDEAQNSTYAQMKALLTRLGEESVLVINGDLDQADMRDHRGNGLSAAIKVLNAVDQTSHIVFTIDDIVRSGIIKEILISYHQLENKPKEETEE